MYKSIFVTGADGFIGSHLCELLVASGYSVRAMVQYNSLSSWGWLDSLESKALEQIDVFPGDVRDPNGVRVAMKGCDAVLHLAALVAIPYSYYSADAYVDTNIKGTLNILQAARDLDVHRIVHTSTSEVYGSAQFVPVHEEHPLRGQSPYSATKIGADQLALSFYSSFGLPVSIARPFNTFGPRQSARAVIPTIIMQIIDGIDKIKLGALSPTRDFSYVTDTARGFIALMESDHSVGEVFNFGSGFEISIGNAVQVIADTFGKNIEILEDQQRIRPENSEVNRLYACYQKAKTVLGWEPEYGGLGGFRTGIANTVEWFMNSDNRMSYKSKMYNI